MEIRGVEFWPLPLKWLVTLTTVLRYRARRAACDKLTQYVLTRCRAIAGSTAQCRYKFQ